MLQKLPTSHIMVWLVECDMRKSNLYLYKILCLSIKLIKYVCIYLFFWRKNAAVPTWTAIFQRLCKNYYIIKVGRSLLQKNQQPKTHTKIINNHRNNTHTHIIYITSSILIKRIQSKKYSLFTGSMLIKT